ncbi:hypothetical protein [Paenibacillus spongiae]|uniref:Uncharacterized protein n=1 Tax=Paenibacillus spongiae TaxID=2909671 RepID=A0ABY5SG31_9BACL|nr:hypothetical protein [Paenibacillus spongiae]UVI32435.1 hypothetical protein L1F29_11690 [Paenibacillus spongiae]
MKIRVIPTIITAIISAVLLIGGWYMYRNFAAVQPLEHIVQSVPGVEKAKPVIDRDSVTMELTLNNEANIRSIYDQIVREGASVIGSKQLRLDIQGAKDDSSLNDVWASVLFDVAQAMETRKYTEIPAAMKQIETQYKGVQAVSEMDDVNVYITLKNGADTKYVVLPRTPDKLGVWPNA